VKERATGLGRFHSYLSIPLGVENLKQLDILLMYSDTLAAVGCPVVSSAGFPIPTSLAAGRPTIEYVIVDPFREQGQASPDEDDQPGVEGRSQQPAWGSLNPLLSLKP
jgi:hypothetical protein